MVKFEEIPKRFTIDPEDRTTMTVRRTDVQLCRRIMSDLGCTSLGQLFHYFVMSYLEVKAA